ncbi:hypothetical protein JYU34_003169 [Plutella xylostella]|uniref:Uncharacterized protein n=1 Tax=Plutella xylostella TaxID=51655 RepID=A0ABQ7QZF3_PLUXY|nr:hypothetical protein JYU34_003169 [Plutella xylostella]
MTARIQNALYQGAFSNDSASSGSWDGALDGAALRRLAATRLPASDIDGVPGNY